MVGCRRLAAGRSVVAVVAIAGAMLATGCSSSTTDSGGSGTTPSSSSSSAARTSYPLTVDNCGHQITFTKAPSRVLILNGASVGEVETFVELGLQKSILANAQHYGVSDDPTMVARINALPTGGLTSNDKFDVPAEQVLAAKPDLVVSTWSGGFNAKNGFATREQLTKAGINTFVNPANCAYGKTDATDAEKAIYAKRSMQSSLDFLTDLGEIFDVQAKAAQLVSSKKGQIESVQHKVAGRAKKNVLIAYPGMAMMNANGLPAVMAGGIYDDVLAAAGAVNSFPGGGDDTTSSLNKEQLAAAKVDVLVLGTFTAKEDAAQEAQMLFAAYPQWAASKNKAYVTVSDSVYFGPLNSTAVTKIARAVHPDAGI